MASQVRLRFVRGMAGTFWLGTLRSGELWCVKAGEARRVPVRKGVVCYGMEGQAPITKSPIRKENVYVKGVYMERSEKGRLR